ncbi:MAG: hypothetical protein O2816_15530 [Planctomycetota bacterium]|nr:hypothetical protein [Planctomycetota bacterium]
MAATTKVSQYGTQDGQEFVAECFAGTVSGKSYDNEVQAAYAALGGPTTPDLSS